jgi:hypothetical protein
LHISTVYCFACLTELYVSAQSKEQLLRFGNTKKLRHDVTPRVLPPVFPSGLPNACAETQTLPAPNTLRKKRCFIAKAAEFDARANGRKGRNQPALYPKHRGWRILSEPADFGTIENRVALQVG